MPRKSSRRKSIVVHIPGFGDREIRTLICDYTGTLSCRGEVVNGVKERLIQLSRLLDIHIVSADTHATAKKNLGDLPLAFHVIKGPGQDCKKRDYLADFAPEHIAAIGNGNNDRLMLQEIKERRGLAIAVENGEGCSTGAIVNAHLFIHGAANALDLLLNPDLLVATLRF
jgi:soluble P-type ATPase